MAILAGCSTVEPELELEPELPEFTHKSFKESDQFFANPERGFANGMNWHSAVDAPLSKSFLKSQRLQNKTVLYNGYYLTDYMESDISQEFLNLIDTNMQALREGGFKCVLRFAYKTDMYETGHPWNASPEWVHRHIEQLKPVLQRNSDVIMLLQAGFIGVWGEWAFTEYFQQDPKTPEDFATRKEVMLALLDAMPSNRQIAVRTGRYKMNMFLDSYADSVTIATAYNESHTSRICGHNDCFGADATDMGTFTQDEEREFWRIESKYLIMGGENCQLSKYCTCTRSLKDMEDFHWTYLSTFAKLSDRWKDQGCYDDIEKRLGYRITMTDLQYTTKAVPGKNYKIILELKNTGFAAPMNPRGVELVFVDGNGNKSIEELTTVDPRYWFPGEKIVIDREIQIPENASGVCAIYLNLPDPEPRLYSNPFFSIRLANDGLWDYKTGYNKLVQFTIE